MSKEIFEAKKSSIEAITKEETIEPQIPIAIALQESEDLYQWAQDDREALEQSGLEMELLNDLPARTASLRYIQSIWQKEFKTMEKAQVEWSKIAPVAFDLRDTLIHEFRHAFFKFPNLLAKVKAIDEGAGNADMLQDLSDLVVLGNANIELLNKIKFDSSLLQKAQEFTQTLPEMLAQANGLRNSDNITKILRDKAFTYMKIAVDEIRRNGQYKFWRTPERKKGYVSKYNNKSRQSKKENPETK
jgi:hypothetical protein